MVAITEDDIRQLATFRGEGAPVTTCYLDVDGGHHIRQRDVVHALEALLRGARALAETDPSVADDLRRIGDHIRAGIDRSHTRGLAIFSCSARGFWRVVALPVPVRNQLVVSSSPAVGQLEVVVDEYERFGVLLVDRQRARMLLYELGELVDSSELFEQLPRKEDDDRSYTKDHAKHHSAALASQHLRRAAAGAFALYQDRGFDRLIVGVPDDIAAELEAVLHPYLRERIEARCTIPLSATDEQIRTAALEVEAAVERRKEAEIVARLRDAVGAGRRGVVGLEHTLRALVERRVETLLVSSHWSAPGWRCERCRHLAGVGRMCPVCDATMTAVDDVVEEAVEEALAQACRVEVCHGNADLDVLGCIGALLRY